MLQYQPQLTLYSWLAEFSATLLYWIEVPARLHDFGKKSSAARLFKAARYDGNHKIQVTLERIADLKKKKTRVKCEFFQPCFDLFTFYLNEKPNLFI